MPMFMATSAVAIDNFLQNLLNMYEVINCSILYESITPGRSERTTLMVIFIALVDLFLQRQYLL